MLSLKTMTGESVSITNVVSVSQSVKYLYCRVVIGKQEGGGWGVGGGGFW